MRGRHAGPVGLPRPPSRINRLRRAAARHTVPLALFTALALLATVRLLSAATSDTTGGGNGDDALFLWWLGYVPHAVLHGGGLSWTTALNAPSGVNTWWQTSVVGPALVLAPLTEWAGPTATLNAVTTLCFLLTAVSGYAVAYRFTRRRGVATLAGLALGFGPYVSHQAVGHPNLALWAVPPLFLLVGDELYRRQRARSWALGLLLALLVVLQFSTSTEVLATSLVTALIASVVVAVVGRHELRTRAGYVARTLGVAAAVAGVVLAAPVHALLSGPQHLTGPAQKGAGRVSADLLSAVVPTHLEPGRGLGLGELAHPAEGLPEATSYLGLPLLLLAIALTVRFRRLPLVRVLAISAVCTWVLSLGPRLRVDGTATSFPLPAAAFAHVPLMRSVVPERFSAFTMLLVVALVAVGVAAILDTATRPVRRGAIVAAPLIALAALFPLDLPFPAQRVTTPLLFADAAAIRQLPAGTVLTVPLASSVHPKPMAWAAAAGYRFGLIGGYDITPDPHGDGTFAVSRPWPQVITMLERGNLSAPGPTVTAKVRRAVRRDGVTSVLIPLTTPRAEGIAAWFAGVTGTRQRLVDDTWVIPVSTAG